jgi:hypothetical protein
LVTNDGIKVGIPMPKLIVIPFSIYWAALLAIFFLTSNFALDYFSPYSLRLTNLYIFF